MEMSKIEEQWTGRKCREMNVSWYSFEQLSKAYEDVEIDSEEKEVVVSGIYLLRLMSKGS
jgi:hypothetical protein